MKRIGLLMLSLLLIIGFSACNKKTPAYNNGVYQAEATHYDPSSGWKDSVTITVENNKISDVDWNAMNKEGKDKKSLSRNGSYDIEAAGAKAPWHEQAAELEGYLVKEQDPSKIAMDSDGYTDAVSGVTIKIIEFVDLSKEALEKAK